MTFELMQRELVIDLRTGEFDIHPISDRRIIGPVDYGWVRYNGALKRSGQNEPDVLTWGGGPLAGSRIPGTRRLVFCGYSPLWQGFYTSSLGGGAYIMHRIGVDFVSIKGEAPQDSVLILNHRDGEIIVRLEPINADVLWNGYPDPQGEMLIGFHALQQAVFDRYGKEYNEDWVRVFAVGPASRSTNQGIIGSSHIRNREISPIEDWAGRGGLGSQLLQRHHIAACIFGGDWEDPDLKDSKEIDGYFRSWYGDPMIKVDLGATEKYRYVPGFQTGGTFGVNMHTVDDKLLSFNYTSIYQSKAERLDQHEKLIAQHYLRQFNEEIIVPKNFSHCGEPCPVACKKYGGKYKKDYEPYQALGPLVGVFDQRAAERLNYLIDSMGWDAIQAGGTISWLMELIAAGQLPPEDFGLPPAAEMNFRFPIPASSFNLEADSNRNAEYAEKVALMILFEPQGEPFRQGIRTAARILDQRYGWTEPGTRAIDRAVFTAHGPDGSMTPNQYWVPGMLAPMPMMGKYFVYYGVEFTPPRRLGKLCVERMVYELFSENSGVCRFHRKWVEAVVDEIIGAHYNIPVNYKAHQFQLSRLIYEREGAAASFWESERTIDLVWKFLEGWAERDLKDPEFLDWIERFRKDKWTAARDYWAEIRAGIAEGFAAGPEAIPDISAPFQAAKLDVMEKKENGAPR